HLADHLPPLRRRLGRGDHHHRSGDRDGGDPGDHRNRVHPGHRAVSRQGGFTYVEVLVASLLIAVALVPLMQLFPGLVEADLTDETTMVLGAVAVRNMESFTTSLRNNIASVVSGSGTCADFPKCLVVWTVT